MRDVSSINEELCSIYNMDNMLRNNWEYATRQLKQQHVQCYIKNNSAIVHRLKTIRNHETIIRKKADIYPPNIFNMYAL